MWNAPMRVTSSRNSASTGIDRLRRAERFVLEREEPANTGLRQRQQPIEVAAVEGRRFGRTLKLDEAPRIGHEDVHVDQRLAIFVVGEVEQRLTGDDADAGGGDRCV